MPLYERIRNLREDKDLTQAYMGKILSCSQRVYRKDGTTRRSFPTVYNEIF